jgi:hypothetical protein
VIEARGDSAEDVIPAYHLANYLLDAGVGAEPVAGTFRDGHADEWRQELAINPLTSGAEDDVSEHPRPARRQVQLPGRDDTIWTDPVTARVDPGGAVYVELMMPEDAGNAYLITVSALFGQPIVANAIAFPEAPAGAPAADYPTPCAHAQRFETDSNPLFTIATGEIIVPDECGLITVVVSHVDPIRPGTDVEIKAQPLQIIDDFERTRASGWGRAAPDWAWRDGNGRAVPGSVADGAGQLTMGTSMSRAHLTFTASIREVLLIGRFTDCDDPNQFMGLGVHDFMPIFLRSNGLLSSRLGSSMVDDFDMCEPWYLRLASVGEGAKVWQATDPEPEDWMVDISPNEREWILDLFAVRYDGAPIPLVIEALDIDWASG